MLCTLHNHAVVVVVDKLEVKCSSSRTSNTGAHIQRAWCTADGPSPQKGRRCSPRRAPSGTRRAQRSRSLFAVLRNMYRECVNDSRNEPVLRSQYVRYEYCMQYQ